MSALYGIDIGTGNLKIASDENIFKTSNTIALVNKNQMYAYGDEAYDMFEKAPDTINVTFPILNGVIADFDNMQTMIFEALEKDLKAKLKGADIIIAVPTDITEVEKKAFYDMFAKSKIKAHSISLCEKPLADAIGIGLNINESNGVMIVDMGADTTEISVISLGGLVQTELLPYGGNKFDEAIVTHFKRTFNLVIGKKTARQLKETIGSAKKGRKEKLSIVGRDVVSGLPIEFQGESDVVFEGMQADLNNICNSIKMNLEKVPPELAKDIVRDGIYITGGGAKLDSLAEFITEATNIKVNVCSDGEETVCQGLYKVLKESDYKKFAFQMKSKIFS